MRGRVGEGVISAAVSRPRKGVRDVEAAPLGCLYRGLPAGARL